MGTLSAICAGLALILYLYSVKRSPKADANGNWILEVCLVGPYNAQEVVFCKRYATYEKCDWASVRTLNKLHKKLLKKHGRGTYEGSIRLNGQDHVLLPKVGMIGEARNRNKLSIDTYKVG